MTPNSLRRDDVLLFPSFCADTAQDGALCRWPTLLSSLTFVSLGRLPGARCSLTRSEEKFVASSLSFTPLFPSSLRAPAACAHVLPPKPHDLRRLCPCPRLTASRGRQLLPRQSMCCHAHNACAACAMRAACVLPRDPLPREIYGGARSLWPGKK